jgi:aldehyde dehydrogenase (NAD(P)+)
MKHESYLECTNVNDIPVIIEKLKSTFESGRTLPLEFRKKQLHALIQLLRENEQVCYDALMKDLSKCRYESQLMEYAITISQIAIIIENLNDWIKPTVLPNDLANLGDVTMIRNDPRGTVLIIGAWNYPVGLTIGPLAGAIAAGCTAIVKPSEVSSYTAKLVGELLPKYLDSEAFAVVQGGVQETTELLRHPWDLIYYTGNNVVGRVVMAAAARHLTPVVLELGGKCPAIVSDKSDVDVVVNRILAGKLLNCGQTCLCIDYVLCSEQMRDQLIPRIKQVLTKWYGDSKRSKDYGRIVNLKHWNRIIGYLKQTKGKIVIGGDHDEQNLYIAPTVVVDCSDDDLLLNEEIFGPILPIRTVKSLAEAVNVVNSKPHALALYIFSNDREQVEYVLSRTKSGGVTVNDAILHVACSNLPFGGVGDSGMGCAGNKYTVDTFVHKRSVLIKSQSGEFMNEMLRYPPFSNKKASILRSILFKTSPSIIPKLNIPWKDIIIVGLAGTLAATVKPYWVYKLISKLKRNERNND